MLRFVVGRFMQGVVVVLLITIISYLLMYAIGDPIALLGGEYGSEESRAQLRESLGLDDPLYVQYGRFLWDALHGDFGYSYYMHEKSMALILERLVPSFVLVLSTLALSLFFGVGLGIAAAVFYRSWIDRAAIALSVLGLSAPTFWTALVAIYIFSVKLRILPSTGYGSFRHLIMPSVTLSLVQVATFARLIRDAMLESLNSDYIRTARSKGLASYTVIFKHALRNSIIPLVTVVAIRFAALFAFAVVTERIFAWPGSGRLLLQALERLDYPLVLAYLVVVAGLFVSVNLIADILYAFIDPRICID
jgi:ABC-type dipeptide/oligopeptide/nickel transport system permease component